MKLPELKKYVRGGENGQVEFKRKAKFPEKIITEIVAFANSQGGKLFIGVDDNLTIPGVQFPDEEHFVMSEAISKLIKPKVSYDQVFVKLENGNYVICYSIPESTSKPHFAFLSDRHRYGKAFVRVKDKTVQASREFRNVLKLKRKAKDSLFHYGEEEKRLMKFVGERGGVTLKQFLKEVDVPGEEASRTFVKLAAHNVLRIIPGENEDIFLPVE